MPEQADAPIGRDAVFLANCGMKPNNIGVGEIARPLRANDGQNVETPVARI
jgi:hypothetical protein